MREKPTNLRIELALEDIHLEPYGSISEYNIGNLLHRSQEIRVSLCFSVKYHSKFSSFQVSSVASSSSYISSTSCSQTHLTLHSNKNLKLLLQLFKISESYNYPNPQYEEEATDAPKQRMYKVYSFCTLKMESKFHIIT